MKDKTTLVSIIIIVIFSLGLVFLAKSKQDSKNNIGAVSSAATTSYSADLSVDQKSYDFGEISMANGKVSRSFKVSNISSKTLTVYKLYTSCMCTTASLTLADGNKRGPFGMPGHGIVPSISQEVRPGEEVTIDVVFDPAAHGPAGMGPIDRMVYLEDENGTSMMELNIKAQVTP